MKKICSAPRFPRAGRQAEQHSPGGAYAPFGLGAMVAALGSAGMALSIAGCASAAPYNPAGLEAAQWSRVAGICQDVVGLQSSEPPIPGPGDPHLTRDENHFEGCIATLSDLVREKAETRAATRADAQCRAQGAEPESPALAECVLRAERHGASQDGASQVSPIDQPLQPTPVADADYRVKPGSYYWLRPREQSQRVEMGCASLGLNPVGGAFDRCVAEMKDTFYAIDNPWH
jgi:hypothetical protein